MRRSARHSAIPNALALLGLTCLLLTAACGGDDEASVEQRLEEKGTMDLVEEVAQDEYDPPADGELSEAQMEMYLEVQERAIKIRQVAQKRMEERVGEDGKSAEGEGKQPGLFDALRAVGDLGDLVTADLRAAKELGHNAAEYQWVREQVLAARMWRMSHEMQAGFAAANQQVLDALEAQRAAAPDDATRQALDEQIAQYEQSVAEAQSAEDEEPGMADNAELVERYEERLQKLDARAAESAETVE